MPSYGEVGEEVPQWSPQQQHHQHHCHHHHQQATLPFISVSPTLSSVSANTLTNDPLPASDALRLTTESALSKNCAKFPCENTHAMGVLYHGRNMQNKLQSIN